MHICLRCGYLILDGQDEVEVEGFRQKRFTHKSWQDCEWTMRQPTHLYYRPRGLFDYYEG